MRRLKMITAATLVALTVGCSDSVVNQEVESEALMELSREWSDYVTSGDLESAMDFWVDDAVMLPPDSPILEGKKAIREYVEAAVEKPGFSMS